MKNEQWKAIEKTKYEISTKGRIRNKNTGLILQCTANRKGYLLLRGNIGSVKKNWMIHRQVAIAFIPNSENKPQVNHKDGNKLNNHVDNLEWVNNSENIKHAYDKGLIPRNNKRPVHQYDMNGQLVGTYESLKHAECLTGIDSSQIGKCARGEKNRNSAGGFIWK